jgi:hypothetical protein
MLWDRRRVRPVCFPFPISFLGTCSGLGSAPLALGVFWAQNTYIQWFAGFVWLQNIGSKWVMAKILVINKLAPASPGALVF